MQCPPPGFHYFVYGYKFFPHPRRALKPWEKELHNENARQMLKVMEARWSLYHEAQHQMRLQQAEEVRQLCQAEMANGAVYGDNGANEAYGAIGANGVIEANSVNGANETRASRYRTNRHRANGGGTNCHGYNGARTNNGYRAR